MSARGFTLLELVIVLGIIATVTMLATREIGHAQDQVRYERSAALLQDVEYAIVGAPDERSPDGRRQIGGFVADMGRLPRAQGTNELTLRELWQSPGVSFDLRPAIQANGVAVEDPQVLVPGGWRGPYIRLPLGADNLCDGWGNPFSSPLVASGGDPLGAAYPRLRSANDEPITVAGQEIHMIRHLGANGVRSDTDTGYDQDLAVVLTNDAISAGLKGYVEIRDGTSLATTNPALAVIVRVFGPDPDSAARIKVWEPGVPIPFTANPLVWEIPRSAGVTIGPRVVRAYLVDANSAAVYRRSTVYNVTLASGINALNLTIDQ